MSSVTLPGDLHDLWCWIQEREPSGTANLLAAIRSVLEEERMVEEDHEGGCGLHCTLY